MPFRTLAYYEARIVFGVASLLPLLLLPGYMLLGWILWRSRQSIPPLEQITTTFELLLTLSAGLATAHLMTIEREDGFDEIRRTYSEPSWRLPLLRAVEACVFIAISALLAAVFFYLPHGAYPFTEVVLPAFAPALYLCGWALLVNNLTGNYWIAAGVVVAYWYGEFISGGLYTGALFLFQHSMPKADLDLSLNRGLLILAALVLFMLNVGFSAWRRRGSVGR